MDTSASLEGHFRHFFLPILPRLQYSMSARNSLQRVVLVGFCGGPEYFGFHRNLALVDSYHPSQSGEALNS